MPIHPMGAALIRCAQQGVFAHPHVHDDEICEEYQSQDEADIAAPLADIERFAANP